MRIAFGLIAAAAWSCGGGVTVPCTGATCSSLSSCGDTLSNPDHCGNCSTSCGLGACNAGVCSAPPTTLYKPGSLYLRSLTSDGTSLYWIDYANTPANIIQAPIGGGTPSVLATADNPFDLTLVNGRLYFTFDGPFDALNPNNPTNGVASVAVSGGAVSTLWSTTEAPQPSDFAADAQGFAFMGFSGNVYAGALTGAPTLLTSRASSPGPLAIDATNVYWIESTGIYSVPRAGGSVATVVLVTGANGLAAQGGSIYYTAAVGKNAAGTGVFKVSTTGGTPVAIAAGETGACLPVLDNTSVYWANCTGAVGDTIWRAPLVGGTKYSLAAFAEPRFMARAGSFMYWNVGWEIDRTPK